MKVWQNEQLKMAMLLTYLLAASIKLVYLK
jgi:hypothetical protein